MEASGAVAPSTTSGEVLVGSLIMMIEGEVVGLQEEDLGEEVMSRVRAMSTYDDEESLPTLPSRDSPNLLAEMVDVAEAHQEVFEKRISLASADDVAQHSSKDDCWIIVRDGTPRFAAAHLLPARSTLSDARSGRRCVRRHRVPQHPPRRRWRYDVRCRKRCD